MRIALWNTAFLGDAVLTLPLLQRLRLRFPDAEIDFYVRGGVEALFQAHPAATRVYAYDKRQSGAGPAAMFALGRVLAKRAYDIWISAHTSFRSSLLARASGAPRRIGYKEAFPASLCYTDLVSRRFGAAHEIQRLLTLLEPLGDGAAVNSLHPLHDRDDQRKTGVQPAGPGTVETWPNIVLPEEDRTAADAYFSALGPKVLGIHPGSVWGTKRWPARYFAETALRALRGGVDVLLFSGRDELPTAAETAAAVRVGASADMLARFHDCSGSLSLVRLAAYLGKLSCYLTNDSGPMHIAWAQHVPTVALFGPTVPAFGFAPQGEAAVVAEIDLPCRPCGKHGPQVCPLGHHDCMEQLRPEAVWEHVAAFL